MKRRLEDTSSNPFLQSKCPAAPNAYSSRCPREFFSIIPHPVPAGAGTAFIHNPRAVAAITGEAPPPFMRAFGRKPFASPAISTPRGTPSSAFPPHGSDLQGGSDSKPGRVSSEDLQTEKTREMVQIPFSPDNVQGPGVKRIWPVMGFGKLEIWEKKDAFLFLLAMPGVPKDAIDVSLKPSSIVVECVRKPVSVCLDKYHHLERPTGKLIRTIQLPSKANPDTISCSYVDGLLRITVGKKETEEEVIRVPVQ